MKRERKSLFNRVISLVLAAVMMLSVAVVAGPETANAADLSFGKRGGTASITDDTCYANTGALNWIKFKPNADGYLQLKFSGNSNVVSYPYGDVQLYDSKKNKALSAALEFDTQSTTKAFLTEYYGVKKNKTYYIGVASYGGVKVTGKLTKVKNNVKTSKKKAATLKKKKAVTSVITAGTSSTHYYKFKLSKPAGIKLSITPYLTGNVNITIIGPGSGNRSSGTISCRENIGDYKYPRNWGKSTMFYNSSKKHRTGTYYVQIKPASRTCNGYYKLTWK
ncbi:MAG: hypothetical protein HFJ04_01160 [Lachnospiraceae bacterium]|nr:hypothetical protein [Lachnospiraceae bacterium]